MQTMISGGHLIDLANSLDRVNDIYIIDGKIAAIGQAPDGFIAERTIDARGLHICPGLVDLSARLREPGETHKATISSETQAAASGGVTTLIYPPDTKPAIDTSAVVELIHQRAEKAGLANVHCVGALTHELKGERLADMQTLKNIGCVAVGNGHSPILSTDVMRRALEYAETCNLTVMLQAQEYWLSADGCVHDGPVGTRLGLAGIPETAETIALSQLLLLVEMTGTRVHICRLSTARGAQMIAEAQQRGLPISADVSISHLHLDESYVDNFNSLGYILPPLRSAADRDGLRQAVADGHISAICSDHQPHDNDAKMAPFSETEPGVSTIEILLPLTLNLVEDGLLELSSAIAAVTSKPAALLGLDAGTLSIGSNADICLFDREQQWQLNEQDFVSAGKNCPFFGWQLKGRVQKTLLNGNLVFEKTYV